MDRTPEQLSLFAMLADLRRAAEANGLQNAANEPNSLQEMLLNPDFIPHDLRADREVRIDDPSLYDDLPPLEDDSDPSGTRFPSSIASDDDMPLLDDNISPPNEGDSLPTHTDGARSLATHPDLDELRRLRVQAFSATSAEDSSSGVAPMQTALHPSRPTSPAAARGSSALSPPTASIAAQDDPGAESDSSLPSLQSVSDSSDDEEDYDESGSEWDDEGSLSGSEEEDDFVAQMIQHAERASAGPPHGGQTDSIDIGPGSGQDASRNAFVSQSQMYRDLLERARGIIPDIDTRFHPPPEWVADLTMRATGADNDPKRAETLLAGMEIASDDLVRRYEKLRTGSEEDVDGCAICRDDLLDKAPDVTDTQDVVTLYAVLPFHPEPDCIIAFPCAGKHLFHRDCLAPWLARKTTCPTCRFDIDPLSLTLQPSRGLLDAIFPVQHAESAQSVRVWQPPQVESLSEWVAAEEQAQAAGVARKLPEVRMPKYPTLPPAPMPAAAAGAAPPRPARPAGAPLLSELLDSSLSEWGFDPATVNVDFVSAYRDIHELRASFFDTSNRRQQLESILFPELQSTERRTEVPARTPSAPPVVPSEASPSLATSRSPVNGRDRPQRRFVSPIGAIPTPLPFPPSMMDRFDRLSQLHATPLVRSPPPDNVEIGDMRNLRQQSNAGNGPQTPAPAPAPTLRDPSARSPSSGTLPNPDTYLLQALSMSSRLNDIASSYMELARNSPILRETTTNLTTLRPSSPSPISTPTIVTTSRQSTQAGDAGERSDVVPPTVSSRTDGPSRMDYNPADDLD